MKALYPFVGGTSTSTSYNLKNTAQYQIAWNGGWTWNSNGVTGSANGYGNTGFNPNTAFSTNNSAHLSLYVRNNSASSSYVDFGSTNGVGGSTALNSAFTNSALSLIHNGNTGISAANTNTQGFYLGSRTTASVHKLFKNTAQIGSTDTTSAGTRPNFNLYLGAYNVSNSPLYYTNRQYAFASIGDGLTDTEAANFYTAVQAFQTTLGRSIGTQTVSDADAQAFVTNAGIVDQVEANAINNLVIGLKADGLWTKMKAVYPFVGGSNTSTSYNLKNTAQYQISWNGGWTWNNNGVTGNGVNGWGNTGLVPNSALTLNSTHQSLYIRNTGNLGVDDFGSATNGTTSLMRMIVKNSGTNDHIIDHYSTAQRITGTVSDSTGFFVVSRENSTSLKSKRNDVSLGTNTSSNTGTLPTHALYLGALNNIGTAVNYTARNYAFASVGDGLTDTDATNLNSRVTTFQTALNRNV
jgi:hypothetical protein